MCANFSRINASMSVTTGIPSLDLIGFETREHWQALYVAMGGQGA